MDVLLGTIHTFLACQEMIRDSVPTCGVLPPSWRHRNVPAPSLHCSSCGSAWEQAGTSTHYPTGQHSWNSVLGFGCTEKGWDRAQRKNPEMAQGGERLRALGLSSLEKRTLSHILGWLLRWRCPWTEELRGEGCRFFPWGYSS